MNQLPRFLTLTALAAATLTPRKVMERMLARREIVPDAEVMFGTGFQPMFSETRLPAITQKCIEQRAVPSPSEPAGQADRLL